ncbi:protein of unknown function [Mesotoga infera]|uniref:Uncharacterized protein n=1 Tax=Mesotoga infera TaxID=1236046 RepID=A0A7Z7PP91_9BACT|nr:protein of unknown function [Mesotoga infera]
MSSLKNKCTSGRSVSLVRSTTYPVFYYDTIVLKSKDYFFLLNRLLKETGTKY